MMDRANVRSNISTRSITDKLEKMCVELRDVSRSPGPVFEITKFLLKQTIKLKGNFHLPETFSTHEKRNLPVLNLTMYRPEQALRGLGFEAVRLSRQLAHAGDKVYNRTTYQPPLPLH